VRAAQADSAQREQLQFLGQFQQVHKRGGDAFVVIPPEGANGVVVGMGVGNKVARGYVPAGGPLEAPGTKQAVGVTVNQQVQHGMGRILLVGAEICFHRGQFMVEQTRAETGIGVGKRSKMSASL